MTQTPALTMVNPKTGNLAFKIFSFEDGRFFDHLQRHNYYTILFLLNSKGKLRADFAEYNFAGDALLFFAPYQPFMLTDVPAVTGIAIHFHPDFFCIFKHQKEVACHGVLFNNIYQPPIVSVPETTRPQLLQLVAQMQTEMQQVELAQYELLISYLKIFLITASRLKTVQHPVLGAEEHLAKEPFVLNQLKEAIEEHYKAKRSASDYCRLLHISPKTLAKLTKTHWNKTLTHLIAERIVIEAKRELYLTSKAVKEIAYELGFEDEYYFSRFFKTNADISPQLFRETVGYARAEA